MWRVVGRDDVDCTVGETFKHGLSIVGRPERGTHLARRTVYRNVCVGQDKVVWARLGGDRQALGFCLSNQIDRSPYADVEDVELASHLA